MYFTLTTYYHRGTSVLIGFDSFCGRVLKEQYHKNPLINNVYFVLVLNMTYKEILGI